MGHPFDEATSFLREPGYYVHDAFGHVGADDAGKRAACFRQIPHSGLDVSSKTPSTDKAKQRQTPVLAPVDGTIVRTGSDAEAGLFHIIKADDYAEWWIGGHHSGIRRNSGHVDRGDAIANMGDTGGAKGVHTHWAVATSLAGALAYIDGWVQYRNGRSVAAWAAGAIRGKDGKLYRLLDPYPLFQREIAAERRRLASDVGGVVPGDSLQLTGYRAYNRPDLEQLHAGLGLLTGVFEVLSIKDGNFQIKVPGGSAWVSNKAKAGRIPATDEETELMGAADDIKNVVRRESRVRLKERKQTGELMLVKIETGYCEVWNPKTDPARLELLTANRENIVTSIEVTNRPKLDEKEWALTIELAAAARRRIAEAVADEIQRREGQK